MRLLNNTFVQSDVDSWNCYGVFTILCCIDELYILRIPCISIYSETCLRWSLCKAATSLKQPASLVPDSTKALESTSVEQPPLYNGQLELAHRWLS